MSPILQPPLRSRHTRLRPPTPQFVDELYELATTAQIPWQWHDAAETPESFRESFWHGVLTQFVIEDARDGRPLGLISAYGANLVHGFAYVSLMMRPEYRMRVWPLEATLLFGNYLFVRFNLRNLYAEAAGPYYDQFRSGAGSVFEVQGRLRDRVVLNGRPEDLYILCFSRQRWLDGAVPLLQRCLPRTNGADPTT